MAVARTVMWFRRDLRLADQPALTAAVGEAGDAGEVVALFCVDDRLWGPAGDNRRAFLAGCLAALDASIDGHLVVRRGDPATIVAEVAEEAGATNVVVTADFGPYGTARDVEVERRLADGGRRLDRVGTPYAVAPGELLTRTGGPYKVFTPYSRAWAAQGWDRPLPPPEGVRWCRLPTEGVPDAPAVEAALPAPGEAAAVEALGRFVAAGLDAYDELRDLPGADATSRLSPYLRWGCIHPRQVLDELGATAAHDTFRSELCWREFYADVLYHRPDSARGALNPAMRSMEVDPPGPDDGFDAWCEGRTGFPIVDAGMRQLRAEGWMHNRVRMLTASFLVKDLHLDWARGARWFMQHLVDGDLASNQHGWQWVAGTGTDASPYFRVFNPVTQGQRFDPDGAYVRRWVPELSGLPDRYVHRPWEDPSGPPLGYPQPIVDHAEERQEALRRYDDVRGRRR